MRRHIHRFKVPSIPAAQITPERAYLSRRELMRATLAGATAGLFTATTAAAAEPVGAQLNFVSNPRYSLHEKPNSLADITSYNNFYEFGLQKDSAHENAHSLRTRPWSVTVAGEAEVHGTFNLEDLLKDQPLEERIYRLRCVEAWSMVIPWVGFPLSRLLARFKPTSRARYVGFTTLHSPAQMPGQRVRVLNWPYVEGLRIDEAMHPLTLMVVGLYGRVLPNQDGAPLRLVVPWKYGFKSIKSIVRIDFTATQPRTSWSEAAPDEYGFYANVNPRVDHPRWSQATERRIGAPLFAARQPTLPFNGYAAEVAGLYRDLDLRRNF